jgi:hypothetical protein
MLQRRRDPFVELLEPAGRHGVSAGADTVTVAEFQRCSFALAHSSTRVLSSLRGALWTDERPVHSVVRPRPGQTGHMPAPTPLPDLRPLWALAVQFETRSASLRARAGTVAHAPHAAGWYSCGARAFARSAEDISAALLVVAGRMQHAADELRILAARTGHR